MPLSSRNSAWSWIGRVTVVSNLHFQHQPWMSYELALRGSRRNISLWLCFMRVPTHTAQNTRLPPLCASSYFLLIASLEKLFFFFFFFSSLSSPRRSLHSSSFPRSRAPPVPSSPGLETVQGLVHIFLVEAGHVGVHVPVVVADVAFCAPVGHGAKAERRRELVRLLELLLLKSGAEGGWWRFPEKETTKRKWQRSAR